MTEWVGYIAMALDGRIADADGGIGWLDDFGVEGSDNGYEAFYASVDALVMGRATLDAIAGHDWPYAGKPAFVLTGRPLPAPRDDLTAVADIADLQARVAAGGYRRVWVVGGGETLRAALDAGLLNRLQVFVLPVVLGGGPLLISDGARVDLRVEGHRAHPGGIVELSYAIKRNAP